MKSRITVHHSLSPCQYHLPLPSTSVVKGAIGPYTRKGNNSWVFGDDHLSKVPSRSELTGVTTSPSGSFHSMLSTRGSPVDIHLSFVLLLRHLVALFPCPLGKNVSNASNSVSQPLIWPSVYRRSLVLLARSPCLLQVCSPCSHIMMVNTFSSAGSSGLPCM